MKERFATLMAALPKEKVQAFLMWALAVPVTAKGFDAWMHGATSLLGLLTALLGLLIAGCGLVWWVRRLRRQSIKLMLDELQLKRMLEHKRPRAKARTEEEEL